MTAPTDTLGPRGFTSEVKFMVDPVVAERIREWARARLQPDPNGVGPFGDQYQTSSLYFDTPDFDVFHRRGSYGRSKLRIRRYDGGTLVFVERKLRRGLRLSKRRTPLHADQLLGMTSLDGQWPEGGWFIRRMALRRLQPVCQISYERTARMSPSETGPVRLTLDERIRAWRREDLAFATEPGIVVAPDAVVVELKFSGVMPAVFKQLVEAFTLQPGPVSKYRLSAQALRLAPDA